MKNLQWLPVFLALLFSLGCTNSDSLSGSGNAEVLEEGEKIFIVDETGKKWDITHAVKKYGFKPKKFDYGFGPFSIKPILNPKMLSPGDAGYPSADATFIVIGTRLAGEARAYPLSVMRRHEIADEVFGDQYVAVAY